jgi:methylated-DNA-[protein]-cysteine S-methyltransferase
MNTIRSSAMQAQCRIDTPLGALTLAATARGLAAVLFDGQAHHPGTLAAPTSPDHPHLKQAARELAAYFDDPGQTFSVPLDASGTVFQQQVWQRLLCIAPGQRGHYGAIAEALGRPAAARAVGAAVGRNPLSIVVPCHRVVARDGLLTGYAGGLWRKQALLTLEAARTPTATGMPAGLVTA